MSKVVKPSISLVFSVYENEFHTHLRPWVVNVLRSRTITLNKRGSRETFEQPLSKYFKFLKEYGPKAKQPILEAVGDYCRTIFPNKTFAANDLSGGIMYQMWTDLNTPKPRNYDPEKIPRQIFNDVRDGTPILQLYGGKFANMEEANKDFQQLRRNVLVRTLIYVVNSERLKLKTRTNRETYDKLAEHLHLPASIIAAGWKHYQDEFEKKLTNQGPQIKRPRIYNAKDYILSEIVTNEQKGAPELTKQQIDKLTRDKRTGKETLDEVYKYYQQHHRQKQQTYQTYSKINIGIGYKSKTKQNALTKLIPSLSEMPAPEEGDKFPQKDNKKYYLHTIAPRGSFIIDLMFENRQYCYLLAINVNTRKLWFAQTNVTFNIPDIENINDFEKQAKKAMKDASSVTLAFQKIIKDGAKIRYLKSDGESAFKSATMQRFYEANGIEFEEVEREKVTHFPGFMSQTHAAKTVVNKTEPKHSSLALIDRVTRTLRDLAYNAGVPVITPQIMSALVFQYNSAPHVTLSHYAGQSVSPNDVDADEDLEAFIVRKIQQDNINVMSKPMFDLAPGMGVDIYNNKSALTKRRSEKVPGNWVVSDRKGILFELTNQDNGEKLIKSRYQINPNFNNVNFD